MKQALLFLSILILFVTSACKKHACIKGIVLDRNTNKPIFQAGLYIQYEYSETGSLKSNATNVYTNLDGEFSFTAEQPDSKITSIFEVIKKGYSPAFSADWDYGSCDDVTIKLSPLNSALKLTVRNETGTHDTIYAGVYNRCEYQLKYPGSGVIYTDPYPLPLQPGEQYSKTFNTCVNDSSAVVWRFSKQDAWISSDTFWVANTDTIVREIKY